MPSTGSCSGSPRRRHLRRAVFVPCRSLSESKFVVRAIGSGHEASSVVPPLASTVVFEHGGRVSTRAVSIFGFEKYIITSDRIRIRPTGESRRVRSDGASAAGGGRTIAMARAKC